MRTTIDLPDDLHRIATSISRDTGRSLSTVVADLLRRALTMGVAEDRPPYVVAVDPNTNLPTVRSRRVITADDVRAAEEDV